MASIKLHARSGDDSANGFESCDFRGDLAVHPPVDRHKTILERDPATDEQIALVLEHGPALNRLLAEIDFVPAKILGIAADEILSRAGGGGQLRVGVWDD